MSATRRQRLDALFRILVYYATRIIRVAGDETRRRILRRQGSNRGAASLLGEAGRGVGDVSVTIYRAFVIRDGVTTHHVHRIYHCDACGREWEEHLSGAQACSTGGGRKCECGQWVNWSEPDEERT